MKFNFRKILPGYLFYGYILRLIPILDISLNMFRGNLLFAFTVLPVCYLGKYAIIEIYKLFEKN